MGTRARARADSATGAILRRLYTLKVQIDQHTLWIKPRTILKKVSLRFQGLHTHIHMHMHQKNRNATTTTTLQPLTSSGLIPTRTPPVSFSLGARRMGVPRELGTPGKVERKAQKEVKVCSSVSKRFWCVKHICTILHLLV